MSLVPKDHVFEKPTKLVKNAEDMKIWEKSEGYYEYLSFILAINDAIKGKSNSKGSENPSEEVSHLVDMLKKLDKIIDDTPPIDQPQRFGNVAFKTWYKKFTDNIIEYLEEVLTSSLYIAIPEVAMYLSDSFGNSTRIDYGTGHEISFVLFLCCLFKIGLLEAGDKVATGCLIFPIYLDLVRKLQQTYRMEPAGSHGVWSLDDYQFVPFIWGSSQLFANSLIEPSQFLNPNVLNTYGEDFMFLTCIKYINSVKTGPFAEHSNQLWSISGVSSWTKINSGLIKMYRAEVLSKFPVIQHVYFGSMFTLKEKEKTTGLLMPKSSIAAVFKRPQMTTPSAGDLASLRSTPHSTAAPSFVSFGETSSAPMSVQAILAQSGSVQASRTGSERSALDSGSGQAESDKSSVSRAGSIGGSLKSGGSAQEAVAPAEQAGVEPGEIGQAKEAGEEGV